MLDRAAPFSPEDLDRLDAGEPILPMLESEATKWALLAINAPTQPWTMHRGGGKVWLMRWRNRAADLLQDPRGPGNIPLDAESNIRPAPESVPIVGEAGKVSGVPLVMPERRWRDLQRVLDEHDPSRRIEDVEAVSREKMREGNPPGRRHPYRPTAWQEESGEMVRLRVILLDRYRLDRWPDPITLEDAMKLDPDHMRFVALRGRWRKSRKCKAWADELHFCGQLVSPGDKRAYCSVACQQAAKKARRND